MIKLQETFCIKILINIYKYRKARKARRILDYYVLVRIYTYVYTRIYAVCMRACVRVRKGQGRSASLTLCPRGKGGEARHQDP